MQITPITADSAEPRAIPAPGQGGTLYGLQGLRFLAAAMVVLTHSLNRMATAYADAPWQNHHFLEAGVDIFFVISGFIMVYIVRPDTRPGAFWLQRFTRIAPLYWVATLVAYFGCLWAPQWFYGAPQSVLFTLKSALFIPTGSDMWAHPIVQQGWTLNFEFLFYTILALCLFLRSPFLAAATALLLVLTIGALFGKNGGILGFYSDQAMLLEFLFGMGLAAALRGARLAPTFGLALAALGLVLLALLWDNATPYPRGLSSGMPAALVVGGILISEPIWRGHSVLRRTALLGDASYAIYVVHYFFVSVLARLFAEVVPGIKPLLGPWGYTAVIFAVALAAGLLAHLWIEKPLLRAVRGLLSRRAAAPAAVAAKV